MHDYLGNIQLTGWLFQRCLAILYLVAFLGARDQFTALLGERGLLPVPAFTMQTKFLRNPSIFCFFYSDRIFNIVAWIGIVVSFLIAIGVTEHLHWSVSIILWLCLWSLYLSIVNVGQQFYAFGWESMLLEAGFFCAFLGPAFMATPVIPFLLLRWMFFRVELGSGLIKLRHDKCWRDLTCLYYHYETQPIPNPLSWSFHHLPKSVHRFGVLFSHFVQIAMPWALFAPQPYASFAGAIIISQQLILILSGNYSWLNWITVCLGITAFNDAMIRPLLPFISFHQAISYPVFYSGAMYFMLGVALILSIQPTLNLFSRNQLMNYSYNPLHVINTYGAFGSMSRERYEVVLEATQAETIGAHTEWREYQFKGKPGDINRLPPQVAPYHLRLDWMMWFIPFSVVGVRGNKILSLGYDLWFLNLIDKLLQADQNTLKLFRLNPLPNGRPTFVRARYYHYQYTSPMERKETGAFWQRSLVGEYLPPVKLGDLEATIVRALV